MQGLLEPVPVTCTLSLLTQCQSTQLPKEPTSKKVEKQTIPFDKLYCQVMFQSRWAQGWPAGAIYANTSPNLLLLRLHVVRRHQALKRLTLVLDIRSICMHTGGRVRPCMPTVCFECLRLHQSWPGVHRWGGCTKAFEKWLKVFRNIPKKASQSPCSSCFYACVHAQSL